MLTPRDEQYWSREALIKEEKRVFEICNGCRLCWNLCPSFPALFNAVDALDTTAAETEAAIASRAGEKTREEAEAAAEYAAKIQKSSDKGRGNSDVHGQAEALERLPLSVHQQVVDLCYQCKLCDPICPYVPPHEFGVDFPRMMLRHRAIDAREHGVKLQDRVLGDPDLVGKLGTLMPGLANWVTDLAPNRFMMEKTVGIHRDRQLPKFAEETFQSWFRRTRPNRPDPKSVTGKKVVLFYTCSVQWNEPQVGHAAVEVLEHNDITVYAPEFRCCGMPALDGGDVPRATSWAKHNIEILKPYIEAGCEVLSPGPTCSYMMKKEWHDYVGTADSELVAKHSHDLMEYLWNLRKAKELKEDFNGEAIGEVGYHVPCHLKVQKIGFCSKNLLAKVPGIKVKLVDRCSCMDGTWGMKTEYYELSKKGAEKLLGDLRGESEKAPVLASDCLIAKLQIEEGTRQPVVHPIELLNNAYKAGKS